MVTDVTDLWVSFSLAGPSPLAAAAGCHAAYAGLRAVIGVRDKATGTLRKPAVSLELLDLTSS